MYAWLVRPATPEQRETLDYQLNAPLVSQTGKVAPATPMNEEEEGELFMSLLHQTQGG